MCASVSVTVFLCVFFPLQVTKKKLLERGTELINQGEIIEKRRELHVARVERREAALSNSEWVAFTKEKFEEDFKKVTLRNTKVFNLETTAGN